MAASEAQRALLLINLGSPDSPSVSDVRKYLNEFLMDGRVIDFPAFFRFLLMRCIVVPRRAPESAKAYRKIWQPEGSPLIILTEKLRKAISDQADFPVEICMRYQSPTPAAALRRLREMHPNLKEVIVLPLYPHYTMSSFDTAVAYVKKAYRADDYPFRLRFFSPFYDHPDYIAALTASIAPFLEKDFDKLLFSYHGLPERHLRKDEARIAEGPAEDYLLPSINYKQQCFATSRLVAAGLNLPEDKYEISFQSRLTSAGANWIQPYTVNRLSALPKEGVRKLMVVCPAFINDCLETLEEIAMAGREQFLDAGGTYFELIPCINDHPQFARTVVDWVRQGQ